MHPAAPRALAAVRRQVGRRAEAGPPDAGLSVEQVGAALEADPADRTLLARAAEARRRSHPPERLEHPPSARTGRQDRAEEARQAVGELILAGELAADGPGRVRLPGFGASTWRAVDLLRGGGAGTPGGRWASTVAAEPAADLGDAAPPFLRGLRPEPSLTEAAARLHALEAVRQDARHTLLSAEASLAAALERGHLDSAAALRTDCEQLDARIVQIDAAIERTWRDGLSRAGTG